MSIDPFTAEINKLNFVMHLDESLITELIDLVGLERTYDCLQRTKKKTDRGKQFNPNAPGYKAVFRGEFRQTKLEYFQNKASIDNEVRMEKKKKSHAKAYESLRGSPEEMNPKIRKMLDRQFEMKQITEEEYGAACRFLDSDTSRVPKCRVPGMAAIGNGMAKPKKRASADVVL